MAETVGAIRGRSAIPATPAPSPAPPPAIGRKQQRQGSPPAGTYRGAAGTAAAGTVAAGRGGRAAAERSGGGGLVGFVGRVVTGALEYSTRLLYTGVGVYVGLVSGVVASVLQAPRDYANGARRGVAAIWNAGAAYLAEGNRLAAARLVGVPVSHAAKGDGKAKKVA